MRHTKASTTTDVYMQSLEPEVRSAINSIYDELVGNGTNGPAPQEPRSATHSSMNFFAHTLLSHRPISHSAT